MDTQKTTKRESTGDVKREKVRVIPIQFFDDFPDNPFNIKMDQEMDALVESIKEYGILTPLLARKTEQERYEIISGRRRKVAAKKAGLTELPVILRDMTRDEAIIAMVDSNLHRERILPSERAYAYKMKMEARKRQGSRTDLTSPPVVAKLRTDEAIGLENGDSKEQVRRYIRLTYTVFPALTDVLSSIDYSREGKQGESQQRRRSQMSSKGFAVLPVGQSDTERTTNILTEWLPIRAVSSSSRKAALHFRPT